MHKREGKILTRTLESRRKVIGAETERGMNNMIGIFGILGFTDL